MLRLRNQAEFEAWTDATKTILQSFASLKVFTNFDPEGLSRFLGVQFKNITVNDYRDTMTSILKEAKDANFGALAPTQSAQDLIKTQVGLFIDDTYLHLLDELFDNDTSGLVSDINAVRKILKDARGGAKMEDAVAKIYKGTVGSTNGPDDIEGTGQADKIDLKDGNDAYSGKGGADTIDGSKGLDIISGGDGPDLIRGGPDFDRLLGGKGNDRINGDAGPDRLIGGSGNDILNGGTGADDLRGESGKDTLNGGTGADKMDGGSGNDSLIGGGGNDTLEGNGGNDTLKGGTGRDTFQFTRSSGEDRILDFRNNQDTIEIDLQIIPSDVTAWVRDNVEIKRGNAVIEFGNTEITVNGVGALRALFDDIEFV